MIIIDDVIVSDDIVRQHFVCNLNACKGACCVEGDSGAPLEYDELAELEKSFSEVKTYLTPEGIEAIEEQGFYTKDKKGKYKTPLMKNGVCAYVRVEDNISKCGIQKAYEDGRISFIKPISCHLYPIRITKNRLNKEQVNYEEWEICNHACELGKSLKLPLYKFVKEALLRKFGKDFYSALEKVAELQTK